MSGRLNGLGEGSADVATERIVAAECFVRSFEDDYVLLALECGNNGCFRERTNDVDVNGADLYSLAFAEVVDGSFNVLRGGAEGDEDGVGIVALVLRDKAVVAASQFAEIFVRIFQELQDRFGEVIAPRDDSVHIV